MAEGNVVEEFDTATGAVLARIVFPVAVSKVLSLSVSTSAGQFEEEYLLALAPGKYECFASFPSGFARYPLTLWCEWLLVVRCMCGT